MFLFNGDLLNHRLNGGQLIFSSERHEHRSRADRGIELLRQSALGTDIEVVRQSPVIIGKTA